MPSLENKNALPTDIPSIDLKDQRIRTLQNTITSPMQREEAWASLYTEVNPLLHDFIRTSPIRGPQEIDIEEVSQETWLKAARHIDKYAGRARFTTWLSQIALNNLRDRARSEIRRRTGFAAHNPAMRAVVVEIDDNEPEFDIASPYGNPESDIEFTESKIAVKSGLENLDPELKEVIILRDFRGLSYREIAELLEVPLSTVKWRIFEGREQIIAFSETGKAMSRKERDNCEILIAA